MADRTCSSCGSKLDSSDRFCGSCGQPVETTPTSSVRRWAYGALLAALALVAAALGYVFFADQSELELTVGTDGGEVEALGVRVVFPAGSLSGEATVSIARPETAPGGAPVFTGAVAAGPVFNIEVEGAELVAEATIELPYDLSLLPDGTDEEMVFGAWFDESVGRWVEMPGKADPDRQVVVVTVDHFSEYQTQVPELATITEALRAAMEWVFEAAGVPIPDTFECDSSAWPLDVTVVELGESVSEVLVPCLTDIEGPANADVRLLNSRSRGLLVDSSGLDLALASDQHSALADLVDSLGFDPFGGSLYLPGAMEVSGTVQFDQLGTANVTYETSRLTFLVDLVLAEASALGVRVPVDALVCAYDAYLDWESRPDLEAWQVVDDFLHPCFVEVLSLVVTPLGQALAAIEIGADVFSLFVDDWILGVGSGRLTIAHAAVPVPEFFTRPAPEPTAVGTFDICGLGLSCPASADDVGAVLGNPHAYDGDHALWNYDGAWVRQYPDVVWVGCTTTSNLQMFGGLPMCESTLDELYAIWGDAPAEDWRLVQSTDRELVYLTCTGDLRVTVGSRSREPLVPGAITFLRVSRASVAPEDVVAYGCAGEPGVSVVPAEGPAGTRDLIVSGLTPGAEFRAEMATPTRDVVWLFTETLDADGSFRGEFSTRDVDPAGTYLVNVEDLSTGEMYQSRFSYEPTPLSETTSTTTSTTTTTTTTGCSPEEEAECFDFALDSIAIDGNVRGSGGPDGAPDVVDDFDDGQLGAGPTQAFYFIQGEQSTDESDGFLRLTSLDGAYEIDGALRDDLLTHDLIRQDDGDVVITATFRADVPNQGETYALGVAGASDNTDSVRILVGGSDTGGAIVHGQQFDPSRSLGTATADLSTASRVTLRIELSDPDGTVTLSFRVGDTAPFTILAETGTVFQRDDQLFVFVWGQQE